MLIFCDVHDDKTYTMVGGGLNRHRLSHSDIMVFYDNSVSYSINQEAYAASSLL